MVLRVLLLLQYSFGYANIINKLNFRCVLQLQSLMLDACKTRSEATDTLSATDHVVYIS